MNGQSDIHKRLASLLDEVAVNEGTHRTLVEGVEVSRVSKPVARAPVVYQAKIHVVGQGRKWGYLGDEVYRVLLGEQGGSLRALANRDDHFARIARVLRHSHAQYAKPVSADEMARRAGMSLAAFHHHSKLDNDGLRRSNTRGALQSISEVSPD